MNSERNIALREAHDYLQRVIETLRRQKGPDREKGALVAVLEHISSYIQLTRRELASLRSVQPQASLFSSASDELGEVVSEAARATNEIMSAAEEIERRGRDGKPDPALTDLVTRIYVACAFQDITGQRIAKVVQTLQSIESKVSALATACGGEVELHAGEDDTTPSGDAALLNGPQRADSAQSQDEIDRLFASL